MRFVTYSCNAEIKLGVQFNDWIIDLERAQNCISESKRSTKGIDFPKGLLPGFVAELIHSDSQFMKEAQHIATFVHESLPNSIESLKSREILLQSDQVVHEPPVMNPGKLICVGLNYPSPGRGEDQSTEFPTLFLKANSTLTGHQHPVLLPRISDEVFCEGELAIVIGKTGKHISIENALSYFQDFRRGIS